MDGLLTAVKTVKRDAESPLIAVESQDSPHDSKKRHIDIDQNISVHQIIDVLKSHPTTDELSTILVTLDPFNDARKLQGFDIRVPGPASAQILQLLVSITIPDHWRTLNAKGKKPKETKTRGALLRCLSSVAGIGALVAQLRSLIATARATTNQAGGANGELLIQDILSVCAALFEPADLVYRLRADILCLYDNRTRQQVAWREVVTLLAGGKILSTAAEALTIAKDLASSSSISWVGDGTRYASWLGGNIAHLMSKVKADEESDWASAATLTGRALSLGYSGIQPTATWVKIPPLNTRQIIWSTKYTPNCFMMHHIVPVSVHYSII